MQECRQLHKKHGGGLELIRLPSRHIENEILGGYLSSGGLYWCSACAERQQRLRCPMWPPPGLPGMSAHAPSVEALDAKPRTFTQRSRIQCPRSHLAATGSSGAENWLSCRQRACAPVDMRKLSSGGLCSCRTLVPCSYDVLLWHTARDVTEGSSLEPTRSLQRGTAVVNKAFGRLGSCRAAPSRHCESYGMQGPSGVRYLEHIGDDRTMPLVHF